MKGAIYFVAIAMVIFLHVKITSFHAKAHLVSHWCLYSKILFTFLVCIFSVLLLNATYGSLADVPSLFSPLSWGISDITRSFYKKTTRCQLITVPNLPGDSAQECTHMKLVKLFDSDAKLQPFTFRHEKKSKPCPKSCSQVKYCHGSCS